MRIESRSGARERKVITGMILDKTVLARISTQWKDGGLFRSDWCNIVGQWCIDFYTQFEDAPRQSIDGLFEAWAEEADKDTKAIIQKFLEGLSSEYEREGADNSDYLLDLAGKTFNYARLTKIKDKLQGFLDSGKLEEAEKLLSKQEKIELGIGGEVSVLTNREAIISIFEDPEKPVVEYPGALGSFLNEHLVPGSLVAFVGPEKRGKTWWLLDLAWRAMLARKKVAFFEVGDMSERQILRRFYIRASKHPKKPGIIRIPTKIETISAGEEDSVRDQGSNAIVQHKEKEFKEPLSWRVAWRACQEISKKVLRSRNDFLKLYCYPTGTVTIAGIRNTLRRLEAREWVPDLVVIDYADILAPPIGVADSRQQTDLNWKGMRSLSIELNCLLVTATQAKAESYDANLITKRHFSEDKRKNAHVNLMIGLNSNRQERELGITRINQVVSREGEYGENKCIHVAGCLAIGNPAIRSCW
jgi:hypothetical protein